MLVCRTCFRLFIANTINNHKFIQDMTELNKLLKSFLILYYQRSSEFHADNDGIEYQFDSNSIIS